MKAFSIRQLKSNPSTVLRAAEQDAMALVTSHQQPTALVVALDRLGLPDPAAVRSGLPRNPRGPEDSCVGRGCDRPPG
jgi:antitoxin (DNA-binding transcriptional repressor) of toxin-antitoxin stability system